METVAIGESDAVRLPKLAAAGFPQPSCWGARGPPGRLRCYTLGVRVPGPSRRSDTKAWSARAPCTRDAQTVSGSVEEFALSARGRGGPESRGHGGGGFATSRTPRGASSRSRGGSARNGNVQRMQRQVSTPRGEQDSQLPHLEAVQSCSSFATASGTSRGGGGLSRVPSTVGALSKVTTQQELQRVLREELERCATAKEVKQAAHHAGRLMVLGPGQSFNTSGRLSYRLKEAVKADNGGSYVFDGEQRQHFQRLLAREAEKRVSEIHDEMVEAAAARSQGSIALELLAMRKSQGGVSLSGAVDVLTVEQSLARHSAQAVPSASTAGAAAQGTAESPKAQLSLEIPAHERNRPGTAQMAQATPDAAAGAPRTEDKKVIQDAANVSCDSQWKIAFDKCQHDGELHRDEFANALELAGFGVAYETEMNQAWDSVSMFATVKFDEYVPMVQAYVELRDEMYARSFRNVDMDGSGAVEVDELKELLTTLGVLPLSYVLREVIAEADADGTGALSLEEFKQLLERLRSREGFTKGEVEEMVDLFVKHDRDGGGEVDVQELMGILNFLGYTCSPDQVEELVKSVDYNNSGSLNGREYLTFMRKVRDNEVAHIKETIEICDADGSGTISFEEITRVFKALGFMHIEEEAVREAGSECGFDVEEHEFDFNDLWELLVVFRRRDGFRELEARDIEDGFRRYDRGHEGEMSVLELGKLLRYLGYPIDIQVQKQLVSKVDIDGSGKISLPELQKLIRMYQTREIQAAKESFIAADKNHTGYISIQECSQVLKSVECIGALKLLMDKDWMSAHAGKRMNERGSVLVVEPGDESMVVDMKNISLYAFIGAFVDAKRAGRAVFRSNGGFSHAEVENMRATFKSYDTDGSGDIGKKELVPLIEDIFPSLATDAKMRPKLRQMMKEVDADGSGTLDFQDFLSLMVQLTELFSREQVEKEQKVVAETSFSPREVEEFRDLFLASSEGRTALSYKEVKNMIGTICPMGDKNANTFNQVLGEVVAMRQAGETTDGLLFPEFLMLMHRLLSIDFAQISEKLKHFG